MSAIRPLPLLALSLAFAAEPGPVLTDLFSGTQRIPHHTYRIPTMAVTRAGTLLAFAEARRDTGGDTGDIDTVLRRSRDGGRTWSDEQVVLDLGRDVIGNACPVVDARTGRIVVVACWNSRTVPESRTAAGFGEDSRRVYRCHSDDDGATWTAPVDITPTVKLATWSWFATGPCAGIQMTNGPHAGRLVVGVNHLEQSDAKNRLTNAHAILSDDGGTTWRSGTGYVPPGTNECEIAEIADGALMINARNHGSAMKSRTVAISRDGGDTWTEVRTDPQLPEPHCMGSLRRQSWPGGGQSGLVVFSNPASTTRREALTLRGSPDDGLTWPCSLLICAGSSAYSHCAILPDGRIALLFERDGYRHITFTTITPEQLRSGRW